MKLNSRVHPATDSEVSAEAEAKTNDKLAKVCAFLLAKPEVLEQLEKEHGDLNKGAEGSDTSFADFLASFSVAHLNAGEAAAAEKAAPSASPALFPTVQGGNS